MTYFGSGCSMRRPTYYAVKLKRNNEVVQHVKRKKDADLSWRGGVKIIPRYGNTNNKSVRKRMHRELHGGKY